MNPEKSRKRHFIPKLNVNEPLNQNKQNHPNLNEGNSKFNSNRKNTAENNNKRMTNKNEQDFIKENKINKKKKIGIKIDNISNNDNLRKSKMIEENKIDEQSINNKRLKSRINKDNFKTYNNNDEKRKLNRNDDINIGEKISCPNCKEDFDYTGKYKSTVFLMKDAVSIANTPFKWSFKVTHWNGTTWNTGNNWLALSADYWFEYKHACILYASGTEILRAGQTYGYSFDFEMENKLSVDSLLFHYQVIFLLSLHNNSYISPYTSSYSVDNILLSLQYSIIYLLSFLQIIIPIVLS